MDHTRTVILSPSDVGLSLAIFISYLSSLINRIDMALHLKLSSNLTWREIDGCVLKANIYAPCTPTGNIAVYFHGGGWIGGDLTDHPPFVFTEFLNNNFTVVEVEYRLLPEVSLGDMLEDITAVHSFVRKKLPKLLPGWVSPTGQLVVLGTSAGAHLALLTASKLWPLEDPAAVISLCGPLDMDKIQFTAQERYSKIRSLSHNFTDHELITLATFSSPQAGYPPSKSPDDLLQPRMRLGLTNFQRGLMTEVLIHGYPKDVDGKRKWPKKGSATAEAVNEINPMSQFEWYNKKGIRICLVTALEDDIFPPIHAELFLKKAEGYKNLNIREFKVPGGHAFDIKADLNSAAEVLDPLRLAVRWTIGGEEHT